MQGNLKDMAVADLIQHNCMDNKTARLTVESNDQEALVFFDAGEVVHATLDETEGEEVIYQILEWNDGTFHLEVGEKTPSKTIARGWTGLLLEGARRLDERAINERRRCPKCGAFLDRQDQCQNPRCSQFVDNADGLNKPDELIQDSDRVKETNRMATKTKGQRLTDALSELLSDSSDIEGAAVVGHDGLVYAANVPIRGLDEEMVGAIAAAILGMSRRGADQLKRGNFARTLIQGEDGNIIIAEINDDTLLAGLTPKGVNMGMAFMEIRTMTETLKDIL